ncbi:MAG: carbohydrate porin [Pseudomonadota bacterium]
MLSFVRLAAMALGGCALLTIAAAPLQASEDSVSFSASYIGETWVAASGGASKDARYLDHLFVTAGFDLEQAIGWRGASVFISGLYNNGTLFSDIAGDLQLVSDIETGVEAARLYDAWIQQSFGPGTSLRIGLYSVDSEFDILEPATLFINAAHGTGTVLGNSGVNGPSIFPTTSLGARFAHRFANGWTARLAILDGVPGDPDRLARTSVQLGDGDGVFAIGEMEIPLPEGKILAGHWRYSTRTADLTGQVGRGNAGWYVRAQHRLIDNPSSAGRGLDGFVRLGTGEGRFNRQNHFLGTGLVYTGPLAKRPEDRTGIAIAAAWPSADHRALTGVSGPEVNIEVSYSAQLLPWLRLQPDIQYIINPGAAAGQSDVLALGFRFELSLPE